VDRELTRKALEGQGVDAAGLDPMDRRVLKAIIDIYDGGPVGIESLAATLNEESDTLVDVVEPFLLKAGLLKRSSRGRSATRRAYEHFGLKPRASAQDETLFS
jgi:Holliday junction DNA helicase RuvB